jgi:hypothetical protein
VKRYQRPGPPSAINRNVQADAVKKLFQRRHREEWKWI